MCDMTVLKPLRVECDIEDNLKGNRFRTVAVETVYPCLRNMRAHSIGFCMAPKRKCLSYYQQILLTRYHLKLCTLRCRSNAKKCVCMLTLKTPAKAILLRCCSTPYHCCLPQIKLVALPCAKKLLFTRPQVHSPFPSSKTLPLCKAPPLQPLALLARWLP